jgi:hypothetical protein
VKVQQHENLVCALSAAHTHGGEDRGLVRGQRKQRARRALEQLYVTAQDPARLALAFALALALAAGQDQEAGGPRCSAIVRCVAHNDTIGIKARRRREAGQGA